MTEHKENKEKISETAGVDVGGGDQRKIIINDQGNVAFCVGSPPSNDWAVIADNSQQPATPIGE